MAVRCETETPFFDLTIQFCLIEWYSILIIILCRCIWPSRAVTINASCVNVFQKYIVFYLFQAALICLFRIWTKINFKRLVSASFLGQSCQQGFEDPVWCFNNFCTSLLVELLALKVLSRTSIASCTWASHGLKHCLKYILWYLSQVMRHSLSCACATNCFAHAHTIALCMFAQLLCACPIYTSHRHAHAIALHMRAPLLCTCAPHYTAHVHNSQTCPPEPAKARKQCPWVQVMPNYF